MEIVQEFVASGGLDDAIEAKLETYRKRAQDAQDEKAKKKQEREDAKVVDMAA